jgi:hypothetical protein
MARLPIKFERPFTTLLTITGTPPSTAYIEVDGDNVRVQMGWAFRAQLPVVRLRPLESSGEW